MNPNNLLRILPVQSREGDERFLRPNNAPFPNHPSSSSSIHPADMIRMSFDQIYRATPLNPMLAQQMRRQQQQNMSTLFSPPPVASYSIPNPYININQQPMQYSSPSASVRVMEPPTVPLHQQSPTVHPASQLIVNNTFSIQSTMSPPPSSSQARNTTISNGSSKKLSDRSLDNSNVSSKADDRVSVEATEKPPHSSSTNNPASSLPVGGSRSRRMASSGMDSLLAMAGKKPAAIVPTEIVKPVVSAVMPPPPPLSSSAPRSSLQETNLMFASTVANTSKQSSSTSNNSKAIISHSNHRSTPKQQPAVSASPPSPPAPSTVTRSGRVSKPVKRIIKEMDHPASTTSYSTVRRLSYDGDRSSVMQQQHEQLEEKVSSSKRNNFNNIIHDEVPFSSFNDNMDNDEEYIPEEPAKKKHTKTGQQSRKRRQEVSSDPTSNTNSVLPHAKKSKNVSVSDKLKALIAEADETLDSAPTTSTVSQEIPTVSSLSATAKVSKPWMSTEVVALYAVYNKTDVTSLNFWQVVAEKLKKEKNVNRSEEECKEKWFAALVDMKKRQEKMVQKKKQSQVEVALQKLQSINEQTAIIMGAKVAANAAAASANSNQVVSKGRSDKKGTKNRNQHQNLKRKGEEARDDDELSGDDSHENNYSDDDIAENNSEEEEEDNVHNTGRVTNKNTGPPTKRHRLGKNDLKVLAEHSSKALRDDDFFESDSFRKQLQQQQETKKTSAVARFLQQQQQSRSPFASSPAFSITKQTDVNSNFISPGTSANSCSPSGGVDRTAHTVTTVLEGSPAIAQSPAGTGSTIANKSLDAVPINMLAVRRKSSLSPAVSISNSKSNNTTESGGRTHNSTTSASSARPGLDFSPVATPTTTHTQSLLTQGHPHPSIPVANGKGNKESSLFAPNANHSHQQRHRPNRHADTADMPDDYDGEDDVFASRVVQKIKRIRPQGHQIMQHQSVSSTGASKKAKKLKTISTVGEISKEINQAMKKVRSAYIDSDEEEEEEVDEDEDF